MTAAALALGCTSDPIGDDPDAGVVVDATVASCACTSEEFCCIDRCQPLGTTCGSGLDAGVDAPIDPCTLTRARPDGSGDAPQDALCTASGQVMLCTEHGTHDCNASYPDCQSWFDETRGVWSASCFEPGTSACSATDPAVRCEGTTLVFCESNRSYPTAGPPYQQRSVSCPGLYGPDAVCVTDAGPRCDIPSAPSCELETFRAECTTDLAGHWSCGPLGRVVSEACPPGDRCLDNASTRAAGGVRCIPSDATVSAHGPSTEPSYLRCESPSRIRVELHGYEWTETCEPTIGLVLGPDGSFHEESFEQVCYAGAAGVRCERVGTEHCDPATFEPACALEGMGASRCEGDTLLTERCTVFELEYPCDPATGACAEVVPCNPRFPFTSRCVLGGTHHTVCHGDRGVAIAEPCAGCVEEVGGTTRCE